PEAGVIGEEERAVVPVVETRDDERATQRPAELMVIERRLGRWLGFREEVTRVERIVPKELECRAGQFVAARFGGDRDHAGAPAELRRKDARQHLELAHLLDRWSHDHG